jgi:hypothetical protein
LVDVADEFEKLEKELEVLGIDTDFKILANIGWPLSQAALVRGAKKLVLALTENIEKATRLLSSVNPTTFIFEKKTPHETLEESGKCCKAIRSALHEFDFPSDPDIAVACKNQVVSVRFGNEELFQAGQDLIGSLDDNLEMMIFRMFDLATGSDHINLPTIAKRNFVLNAYEFLSTATLNDDARSTKWQEKLQILERDFPWVKDHFS